MRKTYRAFSAGELSPDMYARYDIDKYGSGCMTLSNWIIMAQGGVFKRPGTRFKGEAGIGAKKVRMVPFQFSTVQAYALEFGHNYMRVYKDEAQVLEASKAVTGITQASPGVVTVAAHGYANGQEVYFSGVGGMWQVNGRNFKVANVTTNTFTLTDLQGNAINTTGFVAYTSGGTVARVYEIATVYSEDELFELSWAQTADVMTFAHPSHVPAELSRTGHTAWTFTNITFAPTIAAPTGQSATNTTGTGSTTYNYRITAIKDESYEESLASGTASTTNNLSTSGNKNTVSWTAVTGAIKYNIYKEKSGTYGFIGSSQSTSFIDDNIDPDVSVTAPTSRNPFGNVNNYPSVVTYHKQRRVFAATNAKPDTIEMSRAGVYANFTRSVPNQDDDAISFAIASGQVNKINALLSFRDLLAMTSSQEWTITSDGALAPSTVEALPETNYGSTKVPPIMIGNTAIFVSDYGRTIRDYSYTFESDGYDGNDLTVLSKHLFENRSVVDWAYAQVPDKVIWAAMSDGQMISLTYMREHKVWGLARQSTLGTVESVCTVPDPVNRKDTVYFVVKRTINGVDKRYIETLSKYIDDPTQDAFFVDCGLSYYGAATTEIKGLWHLEGRTVRILANGNNLPAQVVSGGKITLQQPATVVHVGLDYVSELRPLPPEMDTNAGGTKGWPKKIKLNDVEVYKTRGLKGGQAPDDQYLGEMIPEFPNNDFSNPINTVTGIVRLPAMGYWDQNYVAPYMLHDYPLPAKILSITATFD